VDSIAALLLLQHPKNDTWHLLVELTVDPRRRVDIFLGYTYSTFGKPGLLRSVSPLSSKRHPSAMLRRGLLGAFLFLVRPVW